MRFFKIIFFLCLSFLLFSSAPFLSTLAYADDPLCNSTDDCTKYINQIQQELDQARGQEQTLKSQLDSIDAQTKITELKIQDATYQIQKLESEVTDLSGRIDRLSTSVDSLTQILLQRIVTTYKYSDITAVDLLFSSNGFSDLLEKLKYIEVVQAHDKQTLYQLQAAKSNYNDQKADKVTRQAQEEELKKQLDSYQVQLAAQKQQKQVLLAQTQGDEANYERLIAQAQAQMAAFSGFVTSQGGVTLITADPNWPADYFSQRDTRWGNTAIAGFYSSPSNVTSIGASGCLITSVAMVSSKRGSSTTPLAIGTNGSYFFDANFNWHSPGLESFGLSPAFSNDTSTIDSNLSQGKWVIVGISTSPGSHYPFHFVVITAKNGSDYNLFDPWKGPNVSFSNSYPGDYISEIITY